VPHPALQAGRTRNCTRPLQIRQKIRGSQKSRLAPQVARCERCALDQGFEVRPCDHRMEAAAESAIGTSDNTLAADKLGYSALQRGVTRETLSEARPGLTTCLGRQTRKVCYSLLVPILRLI
jgi:hypothetical protein